MLLRAADVDPVAAFRQHVAHALGRLHQLALLVDDDSGQRLGAHDLALVGLEFARQQLEQGRLAGAIGADDADAVAALDAQSEVADDRALAEALRHSVRFDHRLGPNVVLGDGELGGARAADHRRPLRPHLMQLGEAALVAAAARGDPAFQPSRLQRQLGVELLGGARLFLIGLLHPGLETAEADLRPAQIAAVEPQAALRQPRQEGPVVADDDERAGEAVQPVFQPFDAGEVEMVGRLVEHEHVRLLRHRSDDRGAAPLAAARGCHRPRQVQPDLVGDRRGLMRLRRVRSVQHPVEQGRVIAHVRVLLEQDDAGPGTMVRRPSSVSISPPRHFSSVVLPAPLRPISASRSRGRTCTSRLRNNQPSPCTSPRSS